MGARDRLIDELRAHALVKGEVVLTSGATAQYYVDAKRAILRPAGFGALAELVASYAREWEATAVGGLTMGADAPACAAVSGGGRIRRAHVWHTLRSRARSVAAAPSMGKAVASGGFQRRSRLVRGTT